ncbi:MAG: ATP-binding cassette domain-containing protein [Candidatus Gastranaerophilales bacterium]|nr:ATP-binding cassette domain-containing protein [Candidatus Gastranaerophilales bacterium]
MYTVEIKNLIKKFGTVTAINNLSLNIESGKITGLIGADGAGKTTLIRLIIGLLPKDSGSMCTLGLNPDTQKNELNAKIGYMPQKFGLYEDLTVIENLRLYADLKNVPQEFDKLLEITSLAPFKERLAGALSGGMKQKLGLCCTLLDSPEFLILDEPSVGVDPISRHDLMQMVKNLITGKTTVLWSTAYLDEAHSFDTTVVMDKGKIIYEGKPHDLAPDSAEFENKVIDLMGGYKKEESMIAKNYTPGNFDIEYAVEACSLEKKYGSFYAVKNNSFKIKKGEIFGLLGPNGAGKSTSFKMMCGLARPTSGTAKIMGTDITKNPEKARSNLGYMAQKFSLYGNLTVRQNLEFFASVYGIGLFDRKKRMEEIIDVFNFKDIQNQKSEELPLGFKQRLSMACALIHNPPVLFLDEPTSGVDVIVRRDFWNHITSLAKKGVTILVTTHFMDEAEYCDRISLFYHGETIALGTPFELKKNAGAKTMEEAFVTLIKESENEKQ